MHREQVANPAPLGLFAFGLTTALLQGANTGIASDAIYPTLTMGFFFGGLAQLLAGMWEFKRQNSFGATAFSSFGAFWLTFALYVTLASNGIYKEAHAGLKEYLSLWGIFTFVMMVPTLELNFALCLLFLTLSILFFLLAGGIASTVFTRIAGWWGIFVAAIAVYIAAADVINEEFQMVVLPLGKWSVGRPIIRLFRGKLRNIPPFNYMVAGSEREERLAGFVPTGKKGAAVAPPKRVGGRVGAEEEGEDQQVRFPVYMDVYAEEKQTGHPYLYTTSAMPNTSFEGQAVRRVAHEADVRSGMGPY